MAYDMEAAIAQAAETAPVVRPPATVVSGLVVHVDGDYLAYFASGNDECTTANSRLNATSLIEEFMSVSGATSAVVHMTARGCNKGERYLIATVKKYQSNRTSDRKPKNYAYLFNWLLTYTGNKFKVKVWDDREADDGIAACAYYASTQAIPGYCAIATADKDLRMLPGLHVIWKKINGFRECTRVKAGAYDHIGPDVKQYGLKWFWQQMLQGDTADAIPGLEEYQAFNAKGDPVFKKMGEKTAEKMLEDCYDTDQAYLRVSQLYENAYSKHDDDGKLLNAGEWANRLCEQAALLWMRLDIKASVVDFGRHDGCSAINKTFCNEMKAAVGRLENRIKAERKKINSLGNSTDALSATG